MEKQRQKVQLAQSAGTGGENDKLYGAPVAAGLLARQATVARAGFNRGPVPPAALAIHLCIGMAYGFSVFRLPLSKTLASLPFAYVRPPPLWARLG
jgi:hypothetical protein